tara:strand:+ start:63 stop:218 length:156 start_codon:yes stop_codon:yes gene_type:complete
MITDYLKKNKKEYYDLIMKLPKRKNILKQMDGLWLKLEKDLDKELKQLLKG